MRSKPIRWSIRAKLAVTILAALLAATVISFAWTAWREAARFSETRRAELEAIAVALAATVADPLADEDVPGSLRALRGIARMPGVSYVRVNDADGAPFAELGSAVVLSRDALDAAWPAPHEAPFRRAVVVRVSVIRAGETIGALALVADTSDLRARLADGLKAAAFAAFMASLAGLLIAGWLQGMITRPLAALSEAMGAVRESQDFSRTVEKRSEDETGRLVDAFNDMMRHIRERDLRLERHREGLERTVEERTRDLRTAKDAAEAANTAKSEFL
ncbi:MAG: HAMP domain-containing protein, partial [Caulobacterales bacterium]|nr:HAMP domain-containing protein [Caulobacterales bacterium]